MPENGTATLGGIAASGVAGGAGEAGAQVYSEGQVRDWGDVGIEFVAELMFGGVEVASLYAGMGAERLRQNHEQDMSNLEAQITAVQNSALGKRSPEELVEYVRDVAAQSDLQHVYIDGNALHQSGLERAFLEAVPEYAGAVREAMDTGGALAVRLEDFVTRVAANEELVSGLWEQLRLEPEGLSIAELENNAESELRDALNKRQREMAQMAEEELEREAIYQHVHTQLMNTGRFSAEAARQNSLLLTAFFETMGTRLDEKARALYERLGLRIVGAEHAQGQGATLNQAVRAETRAKYEARIDELFAGADARFNAGIAVLDRTDMLDMLQFGAHPLHLAEGKVKAGIDNHPAMTAEVWKKIPDWLENPAMVFDSDTESDRLVFIAPEKVDGSPVRIIVAPNGEVDAHILVNAYDSNKSPLQRWAEDGLLRYVDTKKAPGIDERFGRRLPDILKNPAFHPAAQIHGMGRGKGKPSGRTKILTERNLAGYRKNAPVLEQGAWHGAPEAAQIQTLRPSILSSGESSPVLGEGRPVLGEGSPTPEQVKFADNSSAFSPDNDSILYQQNAPIAQLSGTEIAADLNADNVIEKVRDWFKANLQGKVVHRDGVGDIRITSRSWDKLRHGMKNNILKAQLLPAIPDILANGEYMGRENLHKKRKDNIVAFHFFVGDVIVSGETVPVAVSVGEDINGNFIYNLTDNPQQYYDKKTAQSSPRGKDGAKGGSQGTNAFKQSIENSDLNINILNQNSAAPRGQFSPDTNTIVLFENADLSTLPHELGHFFLESMVGFSNELRHIDHLQGGGTLTAGEQGVLRDVDAIMDWFGTDLPTWNRLTLEEKRGFHEQFARGFEQYVLEGKAPSLELQSVFARMRAWLLRIYRHARDLDVPMDDDIRQVFDRMLANEDAIRFTEQNRSMAAMFADADSAGMTAEEFAAYHEAQRQATDAALDEMQARSMRDMQYIRHFKHKRLRELQRASREIRQGVQMEARAEVLSQPLYRAWQMLEAKMQGKANAKPKWSNALDSRRDSLFVAIFADNDAIFVASLVNCCHT